MPALYDEEGRYAMFASWDLQTLCKVNDLRCYLNGAIVSLYLMFDLATMVVQLQNQLSFNNQAEISDNCTKNQQNHSFARLLIAFSGICDHQLPILRPSLLMSQ